MSKTPIEKLDAAVQKILEEYQGEIFKNLEEITTDVGKRGAKAVRENAHITVNGKMYWRRWTSEVTHPNRLTVQATIYSQKYYPLAHLLENGHETYNQYGGPYRRTPAHPHINEIGDEVIELYEKEVESKL